MKKTNIPPEPHIHEKEEKLKEFVSLQSDPELQKYVSHLNQKYVHWDEMRHYIHPKGLQGETVWGLLKLSRWVQYRQLVFGNTAFRYVITDDILKNLHILDQQCAGSLESKNEYLSPDDNLDKYLLNSLMEEAIASAQLEGAVTTREAAKEMLRTGVKPKNESEMMIVNAYKTMRHLKEMRERQLTPTLICEIQSKITEGTLDEGQVGKFRENNEVMVVDNVTGQKVHTPPDHKSIPGTIDMLCKFMNSEDEVFLHPILKATVLHFMIGYLHPFSNGNGRTARALFYWYTLKHGYWLFEYMPISKAIKEAPARYSRAYIYTENDENDLTYFFVFQLRQLKIALKAFKEYIKQKRAEAEKTREILRKDDQINFRQSDIVLRFMRHPLKHFSIMEIQKTYGVVYQTARSDLEFLARIGYCEKLKVGRRFTYRYQKKEI